MNYVAGTDKGGVSDGDLFNGTYRMGEMTESRTQYTSDVINETHTVTSTDASNHYIFLDWAPVVALKALKVDNTVYSIVAAGSEVADTSASIDLATGKITFNSSDTKFVNTKTLVALYTYDNVVIPQSNTPTSLPTLKAQLATVALTAKAYRIAVYYSQIAAFQAKTDYGMDLGQQLAAQAQGELAYRSTIWSVL